MRRTVAERQQQSSGFLSYVNGERVEDPKFVMPATAQLGMISRSTATPSAVSNNDLTCCWNACRQQFNTPELLFVSLTGETSVKLDHGSRLLTFYCRSTFVSGMLAAKLPITST